MVKFEAPICNKCGKPIDTIRKPTTDNYLNVDWDWDNHICDKKKINKKTNKHEK